MREELSAWMKAAHLGHVAFAKLWFLATCLLLWLTFAYPGRASGELLGITVSRTVLINYLILPGTVGMILLAAILSAGSHWGFARHWWIVVKAGLGVTALATTVCLIMFPENEAWVVAYSLMTILLFAAAVALSLIKPWGKTGLAV